jgi:hypothetical protein
MLRTWHRAQSIDQFGYNHPVLVDGQNTVLAGEGRGIALISVLKIMHQNAHSY